MEEEKGKEWAIALERKVSVNLVKAAKDQLEFLSVIDRNRHIYDSPAALDVAIYRYNAFWLPLLAKHLEKAVCDEPLVVPLDCEWIWHCHRLNPVRYKLDCELLFGRILGNFNVISSVKGTSIAKTEQVWKAMYPHQPYQLHHHHLIPDQKHKFTTYDLVSAVQRQIPFTFQVSRPHMSNHLFLQEAVARYKGFLHLITTNKNNNINCFCVPTYDIDLIWHTHQLYPLAYCKDLTRIMGKVLEHDDTDSDRTKGNKLDTGFSQTTKQWEQTFGFSYWKAGAMYRGTSPTPVTRLPFPFTVEPNKFHEKTNNKDYFIQFPALKAVEVVLQFLEIKNIKEGHKGNVFVSFTKKQPDKLFNTKRTLSIYSESGEKQIALFQCEPTGELFFELLSNVRSNMPIPKSSKSLGSCSVSLQKVLASATKLSVDEWLSVVPVSTTENLDPILLHVSISFTIPEPAPQVYHLVSSRSLFKSSCFFPIPGSKKSQSCTHVVDDDGNDVLSLHMRNLSKEMKKNNPDLLEEVYYMTESGETKTVAEFVGNEWCLKGSYGTLKLCGPSGKSDHLFQLIGHKMIKIYSGRRLEYEPKHCERQRAEQEFVTAVEFSSDKPYGRAVALIDLRHGTFKAKDEWMVLPGITLTFILSNILKREGYNVFTARGNALDLTGPVNTLSGIESKEMMTDAKVENGVIGISLSVGYENNVDSGACGGCGGGCEKAVNSGACGGGCGGGCGKAVNSGACGGCGGGGCGGGCGKAVDSGACGGCGGGCGKEVNSGACGGCGGGCGKAVNIGGCNDNDVSAYDLSKVESSMGNEPVAAY